MKSYSYILPPLLPHDIILNASNIIAQINLYENSLFYGDSAILQNVDTVDNVDETGVKICKKM
jgi:hypothetical protein